MTPLDLPAFSLTGPLPNGTTLLEASAGTGKTYAIAALATRYLAEGHATVDQLLMITFGRAATRELRERVREALTRARDVLRAGDPRPDDPVLAQLAQRPAAERAVAAERLARAVADFDAATISTTHQFCLHALAGLGIAADVDPGEVFVEDITQLVDEVVADLYLRKYGSSADASSKPDLSLPEARRIARAVLSDPQSALHASPDDESADTTRVRFATAVAAEVARRRRVQRLVTFDDLVLRLEGVLADPQTGPRARERLRGAYRVVLVDEFQDTDPAQWNILSMAFHGHRTLVLIGDPKQAIYAFRGADIQSYLAAAGLAHHRATLPTNHRSDAPVVEALGELLSGLSLCDPQIVVHPVTAARSGSRLSGVPESARVRLRVVPSDEGVTLPVAEARTRIAADVAADIVGLLSGTARLPDREPRSTRPVLPRDIAVLVPLNKQGDQVHDALSKVGVPSVVSAPTSVFATPAAAQWRTLLHAVETPRRGTIRAAALTDFLGRTTADLALTGETVDDEVGAQLREWAGVLDADGVAGLMTAVSAQTGLLPRVLSRPDGERHLTDLRHVASALHSYQRRARCGVTGLLDWLDEQSSEARTDPVEQTTERTRRLETDADAVQILTVHRSKGLEFPIVYVPFGWDRHVPEPGIVRCHLSGRRVLDVRTRRAPGRVDLVRLQRAEEDGESLRLLYVALTRAASAVIVHWAGGRNAECAPLTRVLAARASRATVPPSTCKDSHPPIGWLAGSPSLTVEQVPDSPLELRWAPTGDPHPGLQAAPFTRQVDTTWRRTSYTGLTAALHTAAPLESAPPGHREDEPSDEAAVLDPAEPPIATQSGTAPPVTTPSVTSQPTTAPDVATPLVGSDIASPFAALPAGAAFGTLVHSALEAVDTSAPELEIEVRTRCVEAVAGHPIPGLAPADLAAALLPALRTPLGPLSGGRALADIPARDRLAELDFELPMGGAAGVADPRTIDDLASLLRRHLPIDDPLRGYPDRLEAAGIGGSVLRGFLTGSIDAVLRVPPPKATAGALQPSRFLVVDYKTNRIRTDVADGPQLAWTYRPEVLPDVMMAAHYPLQALLYSAALHRFLRWRLPGYDPGLHLGGVLYLFLRGMAGPGTPTQAEVPCGVLSWRPPAALVVELSDLLDGRRA